MDELARSLKLDPLEFRLQNAAGSGDLMSNGNPWPSLGLKECLTTLKESELWQQRQTNENEGWGIAVGLWPCGVSPASAVCRMLPNGNVQVQVGSVDISGINSGFVQIVAEVLSIDPRSSRRHPGLSHHARCRNFRPSNSAGKTASDTRRAGPDWPCPPSSWCRRRQCVRMKPASPPA